MPHVSVVISNEILPYMLAGSCILGLVTPLLYKYFFETHGSIVFLPLALVAGATMHQAGVIAAVAILGFVVGLTAVKITEAVCARRPTVPGAQGSP